MILGGIPEMQTSGAKQAAEKGRSWGTIPSKRPSVPKGHVHSAALMARLKPCLFKTEAETEFFRSL